MTMAHSATMKLLLVVLSALLLSGVVNARPHHHKHGGMPAVEEKVEEFWRNWNDAIKTGQEDVLADLYTDNVRIDIPGAPAVVGRNTPEFKEAIQQLIKMNATLEVTTSDVFRLKSKVSAAEFGLETSSNDRLVLAVATQKFSAEGKEASGNSLTLFQWVPTPAPPFWEKFLPFPAREHKAGLLKARWLIWASSGSDGEPSEANGALAPKPVQVILGKILDLRWASFHKAVVNRDEKALEGFFSEDAIVLPPNGKEPVRGRKEVIANLLEATKGHGSPEEAAPDRNYNELLVVKGKKKIRTHDEDIKVTHFVLEESSFTVDANHKGKQIVLWDAFRHYDSEGDAKDVNDMSWKEFTLKISVLALNYDGQVQPAPAPKGQDLLATE